MQRYFITNQDNTLSTDDLYHIKNVMRFKNGQEVELSINQEIYLAKLIIEQNVISYQIVKQLTTNNQLDITLIQGLPKGSKIDEVVRYACLFGVRNIIFTQMNRSIAKLNEDNLNKLTRLQKIALESIRIAHYDLIPTVSFEKKLSNINYLDFDHIFLCDEEEKNYYLDSIDPAMTDKKICCIIGPEGGITNEERIFLKSQNAQTISFGRAILPTQLAAIKFLDAIYLKSDIKIRKKDKN